MAAHTHTATTHTAETRAATATHAADEPAARDDAAEASACPNCGTRLVGEFCHDCGQKRIHPHDLSVRRFLGGVLHEVTDLDSSKILRTLSALLFRPGLLTAEYLAGRRGRHVGPVRIYLTVSAIYFLLAWGALLEVGGFRQMESQKFFVERAQRRGLEPRALSDMIREKAEKYSAPMRFSSVLVSGLFLTALFYKTGRYYVEHLVFSLHFYSFDFLLRCLLALLLVVAGAAVRPRLYEVLKVVFYVVLFVYLFLALLRVYRQARLVTFAKSVVLIACESALFLAAIGIAFFFSFRFV